MREPKKTLRLSVAITPEHDDMLTKLEAIHVADRPEIVRRAIVEMAKKELPRKGDE